MGHVAEIVCTLSALIGACSPGSFGWVHMACDTDSRYSPSPPVPWQLNAMADDDTRMEKVVVGPQWFPPKRNKKEFTDDLFGSLPDEVIMKIAESIKSLAAMRTLRLACKRTLKLHNPIYLRARNMYHFQYRAAMEVRTVHSNPIQTTHN